MELTITLPPDVDRVAVLGTADRHLKILRETLGVSINARDESVRLSGEGPAVNQAAELLAGMAETVRRRGSIDRREVIDRVHRLTRRDHDAGSAGNGEGELDVYASGQRVTAMTAGQRRYMDAIRDHDMIFCTGPAGTGKTYLAVASAVAMLKSGRARRLVLVRPAVEAGEKLGFLPGDMQQKVNPYLRPLLDALHDMMPFEQVQRFMSGDLIEIVPLAFMRGRTLNDAVIILDEAQNTTASQMLMFLTRMGHNAKVIVTGDTSQVDLEPGVSSGLVDAAQRLRRVPGIAFVVLDRADIVRHRLVQRIIEAYGDKERVDRPAEAENG